MKEPFRVWWHGEPRRREDFEPRLVLPPGTAWGRPGQGPLLEDGGGHPGAPGGLWGEAGGRRWADWGLTHSGHRGGPLPWFGAAPEPRPTAPYPLQPRRCPCAPSFPCSPTAAPGGRHMLLSRGLAFLNTKSRNYSLNGRNFIFWS